MVGKWGFITRGNSTAGLCALLLCESYSTSKSYLLQGSMPLKRAIPIVVGVGDIKNRSQEPEDAIEPMVLMLRAIQSALQDTNLSSSRLKQLHADIDHVGVVNTWTWSYADLPGLISERLGTKPKYKVLSHHGGDSPAKLFDEAARRISLGECKVAVITGGEALASCKPPFFAV